MPFGCSLRNCSDWLYARMEADRESDAVRIAG
jgi:hypothetical protein